MAGGASGTIVTNPLWVIKTRFMVSLRNLHLLLGVLLNHSPSATLADTIYGAREAPL